MKTASFLSYFSYYMKPEYLAAVNSEIEHVHREPIDFGSLDAPSHIDAGGRRCYEYLPGCYTALSILAARG
jgi:hypothetical protein